MGLDNRYAIVYNTRNDEGSEMPSLRQIVRGTAQDGVVLLERVPATGLQAQEAIMAIENPTLVKLNGDDALTLVTALSLAYDILLRGVDAHERLDTFRVRMQLRGRGDADMEEEMERLVNLLGYDF